MSARTSKADDDAKGRPIYREERDDQSVFFLDHVEAGTWEIRFGLRATTPGDYRALPVKAGAMDVPEVRVNTDAQRVRIEGRAHLICTVPAAASDCGRRRAGVKSHASTRPCSRLQ